jgi:hypothetical protein
VVATMTKRETERERRVLLKCAAGILSLSRFDGFAEAPAGDWWYWLSTAGEWLNSDRTAMVRVSREIESAAYAFTNGPED